jgi:hypothetical protein
MQTLQAETGVEFVPFRSRTGNAAEIKIALSFPRRSLLFEKVARCQQYGTQNLAGSKGGSSRTPPGWHWESLPWLLPFA